MSALAASGSINGIYTKMASNIPQERGATAVQPVRCWKTGTSAMKLRGTADTPRAYTCVVYIYTIAIFSKQARRGQAFNLPIRRK